MRHGNVNSDVGISVSITQFVRLPLNFIVSLLNNMVTFTGDRLDAGKRKEERRVSESEKKATQESNQNVCKIFQFLLHFTAFHSALNMAQFRSVYIEYTLQFAYTHIDVII